MNVADTKDFTFHEHAEVAHEKISVEMRNTPTGTITTTKSERRFTPSVLHVGNPQTSVANEVVVVTMDHTAEGEVTVTEALRSFVPAKEDRVAHTGGSGEAHATNVVNSAQETDQEERLDRLENNLGVLVDAVKELALALDVHQHVLMQLVDVPEDIADVLKTVVEEQSKTNLAFSIKLDMLQELVTELQDEVLPGGILNSVKELDLAISDVVGTEHTPAADDEPEELINFAENHIEFTMPRLPAIPSVENVMIVVQHMRDMVEEAFDYSLLDVEQHSMLMTALSVGASPEDLLKAMTHDHDESLQDALDEWMDNPPMTDDIDAARIGVSDGLDQGKALHQMVAFVMRAAAEAHGRYLTSGTFDDIFAEIFAAQRAG